MSVAKWLDVAAHARGRLGVHDRDHLRVRVRRGERLGIDGPAPLRLDPHDLCTAARRDVGHSLTEHAVHAHHDDVARVHDVDERCLHAG